MTLTTESLKTIAAWRAKYGDGHNVIIPAEEAEEMARELLANRMAKPERLPPADSHSVHGAGQSPIAKIGR